MPIGSNTDAAASPRPHASHTLVAVVMVLSAIAASVFVHRRVPIPSVAIAGALVAGINPNTATAAELTTLPGIGQTRAESIVAFREAHRDPVDPGAPVFRKPEDLEQIHGIGPKTVEKLRPRFDFSVEP